LARSLRFIASGTIKLLPDDLSESPAEVGCLSSPHWQPQRLLHVGLGRAAPERVSGVTLAQPMAADVAVMPVSAAAILSHEVQEGSKKFLNGATRIADHCPRAAQAMCVVSPANVAM